MITNIKQEKVGNSTKTFLECFHPERIVATWQNKILVNFFAFVSPDEVKKILLVMRV